jgi:hypothetical protein
MPYQSHHEEARTGHETGKANTRARAECVSSFWPDRVDLSVKIRRKKVRGQQLTIVDLLMRGSYRITSAYEFNLEIGFLPWRTSRLTYSQAPAQATIDYQWLRDDS